MNTEPKPSNVFCYFSLQPLAAHPPFDFYATIGVFSDWYQRVCELCVGESFLDAGCESGFLSLVIAERMPFMTQILGVDIRPDMFKTMQGLAEERQLKSVQFDQADLLAADFTLLGSFDTVTALASSNTSLKQKCIVS